MTANTGQARPDDSWLSQLKEEILDPDLPIVDPHHHLWLRNGYSYLMPEFAVDLDSGHNVVATVFAECHSMYRKDGPEHERSLGETEFVRGQAAMSDGGQYGRTRACQALFGNVDLTLGADVSVLLEKHTDASGGRFRGVRYSTGWDGDERIQNVVANPNMLVDARVMNAARVLVEKTCRLIVGFIIRN